MSRLEQLVEDLRCHCDGEPAGHLPRSRPDCAAPEIKSRPTRRFTVRLNGGVMSRPPAWRTADGTCPACGRRVRVRRVRLVTRDPYRILARRPAVVPHGDCPGSDQVPRETRWVPPQHLTNGPAVELEDDR